MDLCELAEEVTTQLGVLAEEKQQSLTVEAGGPSLCVGDRMVLRQALLNLVDNAIKYSPVGGRIVVRVSTSARRDGRARRQRHGSRNSRGSAAARLRPVLSRGPVTLARKWRRNRTGVVDCTLGRRSEWRTTHSRKQRWAGSNIQDHAARYGLGVENGINWSQ